MSRIFPDSNYNIFEDLNNPRSKSEWGYGYEKSSNSEFINYNEFIDKLDQYVNSNFKIWLGTDPYNPLYFSEICIFDQENGNFHLIEYFPFKHQEQVNYIFNPNAFKRGVLIKDRIFKNKKNPKSFSTKDHHLYLNNILELKKIYNNKSDKGQLSDVDESRKKDILNYNNKFEKLLKDYKTIKDNPVDRLNRFSYGITDSLNISKDDAKSFRENNIYKHFFFGNLNSEYKEDYFITSENEKKFFSSQKAYNYGKGINYYGREDFQLLINKINKQIKNPIWNSKKHVKKIEFNFLPVIKAVEKNKPKKLSDIQIKHVNRKAFSRRMRISGVAGSGKTFCLTTRAMNYANKDKNVLYTFFTSSFKSYVIHNLENPDFTYKRRVGDYNKPSIVVKNIHMLFSEMIDQYYLHIKSLGLKDDEGLDYRNIRKIKPETNKKFEVKFTTKINRLIRHDEKVFFDAMGNFFDFDAIMVDEGQNFKSSWFSVLQRVCLKNRPKEQAYGDMMVAFDEKQKLFSDNEVGESIKELSKPELINDPLNATYRIPPNLFEKVNLVRKKLGLSEIEYIIPSKKDLDFMSDGEYEWINIPKNYSSIDDKSEFIVNNTLKIIKKNSLKLGDSAIITDDHTIMAKIQDLINMKNLLENNDAHLEKITDEQEILDKNKNHTTMILTECPDKHKEKLHSMLLNSNIEPEKDESWLLKDDEFKMKSYGKWNPETGSRKLRNDYSLLNTDKYNLLFHLYEDEEQLQKSILDDYEQDIPSYAIDPKLSKESLNLLPDVKYEVAYNWNENELNTHKISRRAQWLNRRLKDIYDFSDDKGLITHTIKSFQGQELPNIFIYLSNQFNKDGLREEQGVKYTLWKSSWEYEVYVNQLFVALTRSRNSAWLFNDSSELDFIAEEFNT